MDENKMASAAEQEAETVEEMTEQQNGCPEEELPKTPCEEAVEAEDANGEAETSCAKEKKKRKKAEAELAKLQKALSEKEAALAEINDQHLRLMAEYDNFRKRSAKEKEGVYTDAYIDALTQILPILDNLDRAAEFGKEDPESPMAKGVKMTRKSFVETLAKMGVVEIEALGCPFDPNVHNAVMHVEDDSVDENTVVEVFMKGYIKGDKVLRYSMVKVAN